MAMPDFPDTEAALITGTSNDDMINGGHRTYFFPLLLAALAMAMYAEEAGVEIGALADQVAADAASAAAGSGTEATVANIRAVADVAHYISMRRVTQSLEFVALTDASSIAWDMDSGINFRVVLGGNRALANPTNKVEAKEGRFIIQQPPTGGPWALTYGSDYVWVGGEPILPTTANARAVCSYLVDSDGKVLLNYGGATAA